MYILLNNMRIYQSLVADPNIYPLEILFCRPLMNSLYKEDIIPPPIQSYQHHIS